MTTHKFSSQKLKQLFSKNFLKVFLKSTFQWEQLQNPLWYFGQSRFTCRFNVGKLVSVPFQGSSAWNSLPKATGSRIFSSRQPKNKIRCGIFINFRLLSLIFEVKKSEIYYSEPRSTTSKNGYIFGQSKLSRYGERKPNNNYGCCVKPILTLAHDQTPILLLSGPWRCGK